MRARADSGSPFISVHPNHDDRDPLNNVFYLSQMMPQQFALDSVPEFLQPLGHGSFGDGLAHLGHQYVMGHGILRS